MVNCKNCHTAIFRTTPMRYVDKDLAIKLHKEYYGSVDMFEDYILGYTIPFYFCCSKCEDLYRQEYIIEEFVYPKEEE